MPARNIAGGRRRKHRRRLRKRRQYVVPVLIALMCMILFSLGTVILFSQLSEKGKLERSTKELREELAAAEEESRRLAEIDAQIGTPEYVEKVARQELGMGREDEIFFAGEP